MPVYLFTFHAYRSWGPGHRRGFVRRRRGVTQADPALAQTYDRRARHEPVRFTTDEAEALLAAAAEACATPARRWRLHLGAAVSNHVHVLVSWDGFHPAERAKAVLHRALTVALRDRRGAATNRPLLARGGSQKRVRDRAHFEHLVHDYLPAHRKHAGVLRGEHAPRP